MTGNGKYTDKLTLTFSAAALESNFQSSTSVGTCVLRGCSESQVTSVADFSTNYCNMYSLYCASADGCHPVRHDWTFKEQEVDPSIGASKDKAACLKV